MDLLKIKDLTEGNSQIYLLVKEISAKSARTGKPYLSLSLTDGRDTLIANMWDTTPERFPARAGDVVFVTVRTAPYNGKMSYTVESARALNYSDPVQLSDFIKSAPIPAEDIYDKCLELVNRYVADAELAALCRTLFSENREQLLHAAAAKAVHHSGVGELLWHVYRMALTAPRIADVYKINKDLLVTGALLHDIGKLKEMSTDPMGITTYTVDGNLFGHLMMGAEMVDECGKRLGVSEDKLKALKHIIVSHHGSPEFGAITQPATPEAFAVYMLDTLDSRMYIYASEIDKLSPGEMSDRVHFLDGASVWNFKMQ